MKKTRKDFIHEAKLKGDNTYYTGVACKRGHVADRYATTGHCTVCSKENRVRNYKENRKEYIARAKKQYKDNPDMIKERVLRKHVKRYFGFDLEEYDSYFTNHPASCDICSIYLPKRTTGRFGNLDHDHSTGQVRGILCTSCNIGLGAFKDDVELLSKAKNYLDLKRS